MRREPHCPPGRGLPDPSHRFTAHRTGAPPFGRFLSAAHPLPKHVGGFGQGLRFARAFLAAPSLGVLGEDVVGCAGEGPLARIQANPQLTGGLAQVLGPFLIFENQATPPCRCQRRRPTLCRHVPEAGQFAICRKRQPGMVPLPQRARQAEPYCQARVSRLLGARRAAVGLRRFFQIALDARSFRASLNSSGGASGSATDSGRNSIGPPG